MWLELYEKSLGEWKIERWKPERGGFDDGKSASIRGVVANDCERMGTAVCVSRHYGHDSGDVIDVDTVVPSCS